MSNVTKWEENQRRFADDAVADVPDKELRKPSRLNDQSLSFLESDAMIVGVNAAIVLAKIKYYCALNQDNGKKMHFKEGRWWVFMSRRAWCERLPFFSPDQIKTALKKLEDAGAVKSGAFNKRNFDKTKWYSFNGIDWAVQNLSDEDRAALDELGVDFDAMKKETGRVR